MAKKQTRGQKRDAKISKGLKTFRRFCRDNPFTAQDICASVVLDYIHLLEGKLNHMSYQIELTDKLYRELKELYEVQQKSKGDSKKA